MRPFRDGGLALPLVSKSAVTRAMQPITAVWSIARPPLLVVQLLRALMYVIALLLPAPWLPATSTALGGAVCAASVASVVLGLAAQNTLGNLIAGMTLLPVGHFRWATLSCDRPGLETGVVNVVTLGYTILRTADNRRIVVPNSAMANQVTVNLTSIDPRIVVAVPIRIGYAAGTCKGAEDSPATGPGASPRSASRRLPADQLAIARTA